MKQLLIHNTLTGKKEVFKPIDPGQIKMYVCGVTPYDECHLGHARCYVTFDFVRRALKRLGYTILYVQNFTDIDDKIIARANERKEPPMGLANRFIKDYFDRMDQLNVLRADVYPRVTGHVPQIIDFVKTLVEKGKAYVLDGDVYYSVREFADYGKLSKRSLADLKSGARVGVDERKQDPLDFALWKSAKPGEPYWESPWGKGRPGWHIECSVMSLVNLKTETFDIHGGGLDLVFPHHENEIAQAEGCTGKPFARFWMHNGFVTVNKEKMSKSLGNFFTLGDIFKKFEPRVVRWLLLSQHYKSPLEFCDALLESAQDRLLNVEEALQRLTATLKASSKIDADDTESVEKDFADFERDFEAALSDDFNSAQALAVVHELLGALSARVSAGKPISRQAILRGVAMIRDALEGVFGVELDLESKDDGHGMVKDLVDQRDQARKSKNWAEADRLRQELSAMGVTVEDTAQGPRWWKK